MTISLPEDRVQEAVHYLLYQAPGEIASATQDHAQLDNRRKTVLAVLKAQCDERTQAAKEDFAHGHGDYVEHCDALATAAGKLAEIKAKIDAARIVVELWRTSQANQRSVGRAA